MLLRFRRHNIALVTDLSCMYCTVLLPKDQRDLHRFVWRDNGRGEVKDFRMTRLMFGVSASSFTANMAEKHNAILHAQSHPWAASAIHNSFYVDDGFTGARSILKPSSFKKSFGKCWKGRISVTKMEIQREPATLRHIPTDLIDQCHHVIYRSTTSIQKCSESIGTRSWTRYVSPQAPFRLDLL